MSEIVELVVTRKVAGHRRGDIVVTHPGDEYWASHIRAGNAKLLGPLPDEVLEALEPDEADDANEDTLVEDDEFSDDSDSDPED